MPVVYERLLEPAERQPILKALFTAARIGAGYNFFFSIARPRNAKRVGACETVRAVIRSFRPKETAASLLRGSHRQKGISRCTPQRRTSGYTVKQTKKREKEKRENDTESGKGEKERPSQSVPCSRIMARTHCSNYLCIRLTALSAESAGRGTCVTNMRARPPTHPCACMRACVRAKT